MLADALLQAFDESVIVCEGGGVIAAMALFIMYQVCFFDHWWYVFVHYRF